MNEKKEGMGGEMDWEGRRGDADWMRRRRRDGRKEGILG